MVECTPPRRPAVSLILVALACLACPSPAAAQLRAEVYVSGLTQTAPRSGRLGSPSCCGSCQRHSKRGSGLLCTSVVPGSVEAAFGADIDYAMLVKLYGPRSGERAALQPGAVHRRDPDGHHRPARPGAHHHVLRGAPELDACARRCAATRGCRTASAGRSRTTWRPWRSITSRTTSSRFTRRCA